MNKAIVLAIAVLALIAFAHVLRLVFRVEVVVGGIDVPLWMSVVACAFFAGLTLALVRGARRRG